MKEFVYPLCRNDLLTQRSRSDNVYFVSKRTPTQQIPQSLPDVAAAISETARKNNEDLKLSGVSVLAENFDLLFSLILDAGHLNAATVKLAWDSSLEALTKAITTVSRAGFSENAPDIDLFRNGLKMTCYILTELIDFYEEQTSSNAVIATSLTTKRKKKKTTDVVALSNGRNVIDGDAWSTERGRVLSEFADLLACRNLSKVWANSGGSIEDAFINVIVKVVVKCLENPDLGKASSSSHNVKNTIAKLISKIVSHVPHQNTAIATKLVNVLRNVEKSVTMIADVTLCLVESYDHSQLFVEILREIGSSEVSEFAQDSESTRTLASYLVLLAPKIPHLFFKWFCFLMPHFQEESYSFRMALCSISGEVLIYAFTRASSVSGQPNAEDSLTEQQKKSRDELLEELQYHVHDVHANVRARAVATLNSLLQLGLVPVSNVVDMLQWVAPSIDDMSSNVRKNVITFFTLFIAAYPYAFRYAKKDFEAILKAEKEILAKILQAAHKEAHQSKCDAGSVLEVMTREEAEKKWELISPGILKALLRHLREASSRSGSPNVGDEDSSVEGGQLLSGTKEEPMDVEDLEKEASIVRDQREKDQLTLLLASVRLNLENADFKAAIEGIEKAQKDFPSCPLFTAALNYHDDPEQEEDKENSMLESDDSTSKKKQLVIIHDLLKAVYIAPYAKLSVNSDAMNNKMKGSAGSAGTADDSALQGGNNAVELDQLLSNIVNMTPEQIEEIIQNHKSKILFVQKCIQIQKVFSRMVIPSTLNLLGSQTASDVTAAVDFVVFCAQFGIETPGGLKRLLGLLACEDANIRASVVAGCQRMFFSQADRSSVVAEKLLDLARVDNCGSSQSSWLSLQSLVAEFVTLGLLNDKVINYFWEVFACKHEDVHTENDRVLSLALIAMIARIKPQIVRSNVSVISNYALEFPDLQNGKDSKRVNFPLATQAMLALQAVASSKESSDATPFVVSSVDDIFVKTRQYLVEGMTCIDRASWMQFSAAAVKGIFAFTPNPLETMCPILQDCFEVLTSSEIVRKTDSDYDFVVCNSDEVNEELIRRFLSLLGHVAVNVVAYLEVTVMNEVKSMKQKREQIEEARRVSKRARDGESKAVPKNGRAQTRMSTLADSTASSEDLNRSRRRKNVRNSMANSVASTTMSDTVEGMTGGSLNNLVDECADMIKHMLDEAVVTGSGFLAEFLPLVRRFLLPLGTKSKKSLMDKMPSAQLRATATSTLAKFMIVSERLCQESLRVLFTIMEKDPDETIRSSALMFLWDLIMRFPNVIAPWTPNIYARLQDKSDLVRLTCANTVCQLILKDMIKVKGQISELAKCIFDKNEQIAAQAKFLFGELAKKNNLLYNVLPDLISRLSTNDVDEDEQLQKVDEVVVDVSEGDLGLNNTREEDEEDDPSSEGSKKNNFNSIIGYIIKLLPKEKLNEAFVEKMCHRFRVVGDSSVQCQHIGFVLSLLHYNERAIHKLHENVPNYATCLRHDEILMQYFHHIIEGFKKTCKPESKPMLAEFETAVQKAFAGGDKDENDVCDENENGNRNSNSMSSSIRSSASRTRKQNANTSVSSTSSETRRPKIGRKGRKILDESSEEGSVESEAEGSNNESNKTPTAKRLETKTVTSSRRSTRLAEMSPLSESNRQPQGKKLRKK